MADPTPFAQRYPRRSYQGVYITNAGANPGVMLGAAAKRVALVIGHSNNGTQWIAFGPKPGVNQGMVLNNQQGNMIFAREDFGDVMSQEVWVSDNAPPSFIYFIEVVED